MGLRKMVLLVAGFLMISLLSGIVAAPAALAAGKPKVAVFKIKNVSQVGEDVLSGESVSALVSDGLTNSGKFSVLEREELETILKEQKFQADYGDQDQQLAQMGKMAGVNYVITGKIIKAGMEKGRTSMFGVTINQTEVKVVVSVRVIDVNSGEILFATRAEGVKKLTSGSLSDGTALGKTGGRGMYADAAQEAADKLVENIVSSGKF